MKTLPCNRFRFAGIELYRYIVLITQPDRNTRNERKATQYAEQRKGQGNARKASNTNTTADTTPTKNLPWYHGAC